MSAGLSAQQLADIRARREHAQEIAERADWILPHYQAVRAALADVAALLADIERLEQQPAVVCAVCCGQIGWIYCPTGGWWAHHEHPVDGHDAAPIPAASLNESGAR